MTGPEYDAELEAFLKRRSPMHRRLSDIDHAEPSVEIDRLVLNRARDAIDTPNQPLFRGSRWALPMGLAATILIAFTVVLNIGHRAANGAKPAASAASPAVEAPAALAKRYAMPESRDAANASADSARLIASSNALSSALRPQAPPPPPTPLGASTGGGVFTAVPATAPAVSPSPVTPAAPSSTAATDPHSSPDAWLREINRLRGAGRTADADRELVAFREAYPTHPAYSVAKPPAR